MRILFTILVFVTAYSVHAQRYAPSDEQSSVKFSIKNFGIQTSGSFKGLTGEIIFDAANPAASSFKVSVNASSVNTGIGARDNHLRKEQYFDVANYPLISFSSVQIASAAGAGNYIVKGIVSIKGISKEISFPFTAATVNDGIQFKGTFKINRRDFNVGGNSLVLGDDVIVSISLFAKRN